jgi:hypothetical protein
MTAVRLRLGQHRWQKLPMAFSMILKAAISPLGLRRLIWWAWKMDNNDICQLFYALDLIAFISSPPIEMNHRMCMCVATERWPSSGSIPFGLPAIIGFEHTS